VPGDYIGRYEAGSKPFREQVYDIKQAQKTIHCRLKMVLNLDNGEQLKKFFKLPAISLCSLSLKVLLSYLAHLETVLWTMMRRSRNLVLALDSDEILSDF
jgi:hypothetical protein